MKCQLQFMTDGLEKCISDVGDPPMIFSVQAHKDGEVIAVQVFFLCDKHGHQVAEEALEAQASEPLLKPGEIGA